jgi:regulator of nucleoside diphosphate kinase
MLVVTTDSLPAGLVVKSTFGFVFITKQVEVSSKGLIRGFFERGRNEYKEASDEFERLAPAEANAIIGVRIATAVQTFANGVFLFLTVSGTPVRYEEERAGA